MCYYFPCVQILKAFFQGLEIQQKTLSLTLASFSRPRPLALVIARFCFGVVKLRHVSFHKVDCELHFVLVVVDCDEVLESFSLKILCFAPIINFESV